MSSPIAFIIGSGGNVGHHTAVALKSKGYRVALGSRNPAVEQIQRDGFFPVTVDAQSAESIKAAFAKVNAELGRPNAVIFNAATFAAAPTPADPLTLPIESLMQQTVFGVSVFAAAQEAVAFRADVHKDALKTFIVTGNALPWLSGPAADPKWLGTNIQKVVMWRLVDILRTAYSKENIRFYFATIVDRTTGGIPNPLSDFFTSGPQHGQVYLDLVTRTDQAD
ncbi:hypothetical protein DFH07DRAFT_752757 [Mycena maculata]|uniref:NAD(P)-binding protein n=1 Tax=Mycena maculata TaxID=230809 RepID=A0AAD7I977_9AGAR|nr:hypothetical protein DFH07DRAFT_752757 [Mycena maculata]